VTKAKPIAPEAWEHVEMDVKHFLPGRFTVCQE
jgi:hypothetical protein